ncbi:MAG: protein kinase domain-containing protein, partial [Planctomycetota bacterium]
MIGKTISHYKILEVLGRGGMGVVYKAQDTKLDRFVALKFLPPHLGQSEEEKKRFIQEAKAASALDHPNICTIYEIDETKDGQMFIAMACYEGESLKERIERGPMALDEALDIAVQVAQGISRAHEENIVHRDIKPANIIITNRGEVKIVDFGLAKLAGRTMLTKEGTTMGTVAYMSPEQSQGAEVNHRSDIWALGAVLYEMVTGQRPFAGDYEQAVVYSILNQEPEPVTGLRTGVPMALERIINKAMQKTPEERYQHTNDMLVDLRAVGKSFGGRGAANAPSNKKRLRFRIGTAALVALVIFAGFFVWQYAKKPAKRNEPMSTPGRKVYQGSIAVLPLENLSDNPEQEYFADGMTEALITQLAQIRALKVISRTTVIRYKATDEPLVDIARKLNVGTILEGSVLLVGDQVRINAQLIDGSTDSHIWAKSYEGELSDVIGLQSEVARSVADEIKVQLTSEEQSRLARQRPVDAEVYRIYLKGRYHLNKFTPPGVRQGMAYFQQVVEKDPNYALAYAGLADSYLVLARWGVAHPI